MVEPTVFSVVGKGDEFSCILGKICDLMGTEGSRWGQRAVDGGAVVVCLLGE